MRTMMIDISSKFLWAEAAATAVYIKNQLPHSRLPDRITPYQALYGRKPSIKHLQPFGRRCYVHIPEEIRPSGSMLLARSIEGIFVGYTAKSNQIYRIWIPSKPNQIRESRDIRFAPIPEKSVSFDLQLSSNSRSVDNQLSDSQSIDNRSLDFQPVDNQLSSNSQPSPPQIPSHPISPTSQAEFIEETPNVTLWRSNRQRKQPERYRRQVTYLPDEPATYTQAIKCVDAELWIKAMVEEMESLQKNGTWEEVELPQGRKTVDSKWVFKVKQKADGSVDRYKARVVGKGFSQKFGTDYKETYALVARYTPFDYLLPLPLTINGSHNKGM